jgi:hypothetical protein
MAMVIAMVTTMRLADDKEGKGRAARVMATAMKVVGNKEGEGNKTMLSFERSEAN